MVILPMLDAGKRLNQRGAHDFKLTAVVGG
jgi:hypothetical protein